MPLQEGKTARGQKEKNQLYHRFRLAPEGFSHGNAWHGKATDFGLRNQITRGGKQRHLDELRCRHTQVTA
jgi:hypothetical protein